MPDHPVDPFDPVIAALIRSKAAKLAKINTDPALDSEDIVQHLLLTLLERRQKYDPARGSPLGFGVRLIQNASANLLRALRAEKRTPPTTTTPPHAVADHRGLDDEIRDLLFDVREVLRGLSPDESAIAALLGRLGATDVARESGVSRGTIYNHRRALRQQFENAGLAIYLRRIDRTL